MAINGKGNAKGIRSELLRFSLCPHPLTVSRSARHSRIWHGAGEPVSELRRPAQDFANGSFRNWANDTLLGHDALNEPGGRHVEGRVVDRDAGGGRRRAEAVCDLACVALLDGDVLARRQAEVK